MPGLLGNDPPSPPPGSADIFPTLFNRLLDSSLPFAFHFQPIIDLRHACIVGYEALVRFPPEIGLPPDRVRRRLRPRPPRAPRARRLRRDFDAHTRLPPNTFLSLNISPQCLLSDGWDAILRNLSTLAGTVIEITEQDRVADYSLIRRKAAAIAAVGGNIAIDDTGSGYSSLQHVMELPPNFVKIDRFFIGGCDTDRARSAMIEMIGTTTDRLDAWIVAEGVETSGELDELIRLGVPLVQGFYLGVPGPTMAGLPPETVTEIKSRVRAILRIGTPERVTIERFAETCCVTSNRTEAQAFLSAVPTADLAVVVDASGRPLQIFETHPIAGPRTLPSLLKIQTTTDPSEALHRALTRPTRERFDPFAVTNEQGAFTGVVRIDRLMRGILESRSTPEDPTRLRQS